MTSLTARFQKAPSEVRRYVLDYTLDLNPGETLASLAYTVTSPTGALPSTLTVSGVVLVGVSPIQAVYYVSGGLDGNSYEIQFEATTSIGQVLEDIAQHDIANKV